MAHGGKGRQMAAGDFYFAINATFRFLLNNYGEEALIAYWRALGTEYYAPVAERFRGGGLEEVERYWRDFFANEPGGDVGVTRGGSQVDIEVRDCPALRWLNAHKREIAPCYCGHCRHVSSAIAQGAGLGFALDGGGGRCHQRFFREHAA